MTLYQASWCGYCRQVIRKLKELAISYEAVEVLPLKPLRKELFEASGQYGVPTLIDGDVIIADDDDAIIAYLGSKYPKTSDETA